jgi:hypothetical protein
MDTNEAPANAMDTMSEATEAAAGLLPLDMGNVYCRPRRPRVGGYTPPLAPAPGTYVFE